jgi:hypothetical protein
MAHHLILDSTSVGTYMSAYFILTQLLFLAIVYVFVKLDWRAWFLEKAVRWSKGSPEKQP